MRRGRRALGRSRRLRALLLRSDRVRGRRHRHRPQVAGGQGLRGDIEWFSGRFTGSSASLASVGGGARLRATTAPDLVSGTITFPGGRRCRFFALPAGQGAGIYDVTVTPDGRLQGTSEEGGHLTARQDGEFVVTTVTAPDGRSYTNRPADLTRTLRYRILGNEPDTYVAIVALRGRFIFGRSGDVRGGTFGTNIMGLDKAC